MTTTSSVPHLRVVVAVCVLSIVGYAGFSIWVVGWSGDAALRGDVIGTWKSFAVLAVGFWIGSSSAGKSSAADQQQAITDLAGATHEMAKSVPNSTDTAALAADAVASAATDEADRIKGEGA